MLTKSQRVHKIMHFTKICSCSILQLFQQWTLNIKKQSCLELKTQNFGLNEFFFCKIGNISFYAAHDFHADCRKKKKTKMLVVENFLRDILPQLIFEMEMTKKYLQIQKAIGSDRKSRIENILTQHTMLWQRRESLVILKEDKKEYFRHVYM